MRNLKFELMIAYYKRPTIVLNALNSIKEAKYDNWHLTFIDDSGNEDFKETLFNMGFDDDKITYKPIMMTDFEKIENGGSVFGKYVNETIQNTDSDIVILICDDDALFPDYMENLNKFYNENPDKMWAYSHVKFFNPEIETYKEAKDLPTDMSFNTSNLNQYTVPILPSCKVDSSQVSFRKEAFTKSNLWYPYPHTMDLDRNVFEKMGNYWGPCHFADCYGQCKGWFENQLGVRARRKNIVFTD